MKRRNFIRQSGLTLGSFFILPQLFAGGIPLANDFVQTISSNNFAGQIRHGALQLPQLGFNDESIDFAWLKDISRNVFYKNGFEPGEAGDDMDIVSILLEDQSSGEIEALQLSKQNGQTKILFGEKEWEIKHDIYGIQALTELADNTIVLHFGNFKEQAKFIKKFAVKSDTLVYLLNGSMAVNGQKITTDLGLGFKHVHSLSFEVSEGSTFLLIEHKADIQP